MEASTFHNMTLDTCTFYFIVSIVTSKMELIKTVFNSFYFLTIVTNNSISGVLDPTLITDIFALHSWILINLKSILASYRNRLINSNSKEDGQLLGDGCYEMGLCSFQIAWENSCALDEVLTFNRID